MINRKCPDCGGYDLDNGVDDLCYCDDEDEVSCANDCGETVLYGGFCSRKCHEEWLSDQGDEDDYG